MNNKEAGQPGPSSLVALPVKIRYTEGRGDAPCAEAKGRLVTALCVDGYKYYRLYDSPKEAKLAAATLRRIILEDWARDLGEGDGRKRLIRKLSEVEQAKATRIRTVYVKEGVIARCISVKGRVLFVEDNTGARYSKEFMSKREARIASSILTCIIPAEWHALGKTDENMLSSKKEKKRKCDLIEAVKQGVAAAVAEKIAVLEAAKAKQKTLYERVEALETALKTLTRETHYSRNGKVVEARRKALALL